MKSIYVALFLFLESLLLTIVHACIIPFIWWGDTLRKLHHKWFVIHVNRRVG